MSILLLFLFLLTCGVTIGFKPFVFKLKDPLHGVGWVLTVLGIMFLLFSMYQRGAKDAAKEILPRVDKMVENIKIVHENNEFLRSRLNEILGINKDEEDDLSKFSNRKL